MMTVLSHIMELQGRMCHQMKSFSVNIHAVISFVHVLSTLDGKVLPKQRRFDFIAMQISAHLVWYLHVMTSVFLR
jgi:hypothetical protein